MILMFSLASTTPDQAFDEAKIIPKSVIPYPSALQTNGVDLVAGSAQEKPED